MPHSCQEEYYVFLSVVSSATTGRAVSTSWRIESFGGGPLPALATTRAELLESGRQIPIGSFPPNQNEKKSSAC